MKKLITIALLFIAMGATAQTKVTKDAQGNYIQAKRDTAVNKPTGHNLVDRDGIAHPVFISARGKLFWFRTSKAGNIYKAYIKED